MTKADDGTSFASILTVRVNQARQVACKGVSSTNIKTMASYNEIELRCREGNSAPHITSGYTGVHELYS